MFYSVRLLLSVCACLERARRLLPRRQHAAQTFTLGPVNDPGSRGDGRRSAAGSRAGVQRNHNPSVVSAPAAFQTAFQDAINLYQTTYTDPITITINIEVGWGEIDGNPLNPGNLGQSRTNQPGNFTYSQVRSALISDAKSAADFQGISRLGVTDPTGGRAFRMSDAEAKALGLRAANAPDIDGWVGFSNTASYTFDPNNRAVAGQYDFIGVAEHEIAEVMGRYGMTQNCCGATLCDSPIDLFRYTSPGNFDLNPENGSYFSIESGNTNINTFNGTSGAISATGWD